MEINVRPDWAKKGREKTTTINKRGSPHFLGMQSAAGTMLHTCLVSNLNLTMNCKVGTSDFVFTDEGKENERT